MTAHQLTIGEIQCAVLHEGGAPMTAESLAGRYPGVSAAEIEAALAGQQPSGSLNLLYINSGGRRIVADVGFGAAGRPATGQLVPALNSIGIDAADIDIVYLTHFHGDHIAGLANADGALLFPNADYVTTQAEWDEWIGRWTASDAPQDNKTLDLFTSLRPKFSFVSDGDEVAPGVTAVDLEGHTLGHSGLLIESGGDSLLHVVDILHQPFQFSQTGWHFSFDSDPLLAVKTRRRILQHCADGEILTLFYHMPFPGLGTVSMEAEFFVWNPIA